LLNHNTHKCWEKTHKLFSQADYKEHSHTLIKQSLMIKELWSSLGCPGGHDLEDKAIHSTYSTKHNLIWEFLKGNSHRNKSKARSGTWVA
jgi:hypothetical protein